MVSIMKVRYFIRLVLAGAVSDKTGHGHLCSEDGNYQGETIIVKTLTKYGVKSLNLNSRLTHVHWTDYDSNPPKQGMELFIDQLIERAYKGTPYDTEQLLKTVPCGHCDNNQPLDGDRHVWEDGSYVFCPKQLKLVRHDQTIGDGQPVFNTQWSNIWYTVCKKCGVLVSLRTCWAEKDGSQVHRACLTQTKIHFWPDGDWCHQEDIEDFAWKSDDYTTMSVSNELDEDEINDLVTGLI